MAATPARTARREVRDPPAPGVVPDTGVLGEVATVEEAFALVAVNLPEGCGPAIIGTANDL